MAEILRAEWFDINNKKKDKLCSWLHGVFFPDLQSQNGVNWVAHYDIVPHPETRYIKGAILFILPSNSVSVHSPSI